MVAVAARGTAARKPRRRRSGDFPIPGEWRLSARNFTGASVPLMPGLE
jgi:hypothetical protein